VFSGGVYVYGLFLEGAGWDKKQMKLIESQPKVIHTSMPVVHVYAININVPRDDKKMQGLQLYQCPVYKKPRRTGGSLHHAINMQKNKCFKQSIKQYIYVVCGKAAFSMSFLISNIMILILEHATKHLRRP